MNLDWIDESLREDREEALQHGEVVATDAAVATCKRIAGRIARLDSNRVASWPVFPGGSKWVVFGEDGGGVSLVLVSLANDRRVDFHIWEDGKSVAIIVLDEHLGSCRLPLTDEPELKLGASWSFLCGNITLAQWVTAMKPGKRVLPVDASRESIYEHRTTMGSDDRSR